MSDQNWQCQEGDPFKPVQPEIDPRFAAAHYGNDLKAAEDRRILQAKGKHPAPCARFCESNAYEIEIRRLKRQVANYSEINRQRREAVEHVALLESEAEQLRMSVHNARIELGDAKKLNWDDVSTAANIANQQYGQFMPTRWIESFVASYNSKDAA